MIKEIIFGTPLCFTPNGPLEWYENSVNGTFINEHNNKPISIMINNGVVIRGNSCHYQWGYPETVVFIRKNGSFGSMRVKTYTQIPDYQNIVFAIGGVGISDFNPKAEGFCKFTKINSDNGKLETIEHGDVLRRTNHSIFGFKGDKFFGGVVYGNSEEIITECEKQGFTHVIIGDGGKYAGINGDVKLNTSFIQHSAVQITNVVEVPLIKEKRKWKYFKYSEFANSLDGGANETKHELIDKCDILRIITGQSTHVLSGYRTKPFNKKCGGSPGSYHTKGLAADLRFNFKGWSYHSLARVAKYIGFTNIGFYWKYGKIGYKLDRIHVDIGKPKDGSDFRIMHWHTNGRYIK